MGLFSKLLKGNDVPDTFSNEEAFFGLTLAIVAADGDISSEEFDDLKSILNKSNTLAKLDDRRYSQVIDKVIKVYKRVSIGELLDLSVAGLNPELREGVFALCCDLAYSDGYIEKSEEQVLEGLQKAFNIPESKALNIVEIITIKNRV